MGRKSTKYLQQFPYMIYVQEWGMDFSPEQVKAYNAANKVFNDICQQLKDKPDFNEVEVGIKFITGLIGPITKKTIEISNDLFLENLIRQNKVKDTRIF